MKFSKIKRRCALFIINHFYCGTHFFKIKRALLRWAGFEIGKNTRIVGPIYCTADLKVGSSVWIGRDFCAEGNGSVVIEDNCDIAPHVVFLTGSHRIGGSERRAGEGISTKIYVKKGSWIGARSTILGDCEIGNGCVIAACALVRKKVPDNCVYGGVPAKLISKL